MDLKQYLRSILANKLISLVKKNQCEVCNNKKNLEVHHIQRFSIILEETLRELNLECKDTKDYIENQLSIITNIILGKHLQIEYLTLCKKCHANIHSLEDGGTYNIGEGFKLHYVKHYLIKAVNEKNKIEELKKYLPTLINKLIFKEDKKLLINKISLRRDGKQMKSYDSFNAYFKENEIPYLISGERSAKRVKGKVISFRYWKVVNI